jgi:hypothetical protein
MTETKTFKIPVSNGLLGHCPEMGESIWYFLWCIDKTTREVADGTGNLIGTVLGGMPCCDEDVAGTLGREVKTIRRWRKHLTKTGYIQTKRTPIGYSIKVSKSKKWVGKGADKNVQSLTKSNPEGLDKNVQSPKSDLPFGEVRKDICGSRLPETGSPYRQYSDLTKTEQRESGEKASLALTSSEGGQGKAMTDYIVKVAKGIKTGASFSTKAKEQLKQELSEIAPRPTEAELKRAVSDQIEAMDPFALKNAGSSIAASLVGAIGAIRDAAKATQDRKNDKQEIEQSEIARNKWRKGLDEATEIDQYVQDNPPPKWFVEYEGSKTSLPYAEEYIEDARRSLARRHEPEVADAVF